jgi:hypothetical protein
VHIPEWLDFNRTDPGATLLELLAFLGENLLYGKDRPRTANRRTWVQIALSITVLGATMLAWRCARRRNRKAPADRAGFAKPWGSGSRANTITVHSTMAEVTASDHAPRRILGG